MRAVLELLEAWVFVEHCARRTVGGGVRLPTVPICAVVRIGEGPS